MLTLVRVLLRLLWTRAGRWLVGAGVLLTLVPLAAVAVAVNRRRQEAAEIRLRQAERRRDDAERSLRTLDLERAREEVEAARAHRAEVELDIEEARADHAWLEDGALAMLAPSELLEERRRARS